MQLGAIPLSELKLRVAHCDMLDKLIQVADGDAALLYLYLLRNGNPSNGYAVDDIIAMRELRMPKDRYERAVFTLGNLTLSSSAPAAAASASTTLAASTAASSPKPGSNPPNYTPDEMYRARKDDRCFEAVCHSAEEVWGCVLKEKQLRCLLTAYDYLGLSADAIIELLFYPKREKGAVRLADVQREANLWANAGVVSAQDAQRYLASKVDEQPLIAALCKGLGIDPTQASPKIQEAATLLLVQGFPPEAIELAMRRGERQQGQKKLDYVLGILRRWHLTNVHTVSEITALEPETRMTSAVSAVSIPSSGSFTGSSAGSSAAFSSGIGRSWRESIWDDMDSSESAYASKDNTAEEEELWKQTWLKQFRKGMQQRKEAQTKDDV